MVYRLTKAEMDRFNVLNMTVFSYSFPNFWLFAVLKIEIRHILRLTSV